MLSCHKRFVQPGVCRGGGTGSSPGDYTRKLKILISTKFGTATTAATRIPAIVTPLLSSVGSCKRLIEDDVLETDSDCSSIVNHPVRRACRQYALRVIIAECGEQHWQDV
jgi:hypothetical protein